MSIQQQLLDDIMLKLVDSPTIIMKYVDALKITDIQEGKDILEKLKFKLESLDWAKRREERLVDFNRWLSNDFKSVEEVQDFRDLKTGERVLILFSKEFDKKFLKDIHYPIMVKASITTCFINITKIECFPDHVLIDYIIEKLPFDPHSEGYPNFAGSFKDFDKQTKSEKYDLKFGKWFIIDFVDKIKEKFLTQIYRFSESKYVKIDN